MTTVRWWRSDRGSVTTEMTVLTPLLVLLLVYVAVVVHRGVSVRLRLDAVAHQAARAASMERRSDAAIAVARSTAVTALANAGVLCESLHVGTATNSLTPGSTVTVTVTCAVDLTETLLPGLSPASLSSTATEPVDVWRSTTQGMSQ